MAASDSYKYLLEDIENFKKHDTDKSVTLNEAQLKEQRDADEKKNLEKENLRRVALVYLL